MESAELKFRDQSITLPILEGVEGELAIDISSLRKQTGMITIDHGFVNTGSCESKITFIDGEKGILRYRGYPIEELAEQSDFLEVSYLLIYGELPTQEQYDNFYDQITRHTMLHEDMRIFFNAFPRDAHPMAILSSAVASMSTFYQDTLNPLSSQDRRLNIARLLAKMPTIAAYSYKRSVGHPSIYPNNNLNYVANFLNMCFSVPAENYEMDPDVVKALDMLFILHADHEQNCSTSTVRMVGSSQANLYASISSGICALWGPLHGGANQKVLEMLARIQADNGNVSKYIEMAKEKDSDFRLFGFGHRVYKNFDPRARLIKKYCDIILKKMGVRDPLLETAKRLEEAALEDPYFVERKLYPNVDFYSGIIYRALGFPVEMFTVLFALGRLPGWIAQWREMIQSKDTRIGRPRQVYQGEQVREFKSHISNRRS
ncbi:MAG: citrate synthase [Acidobacteria bacterium]|nr:citrate synthase [Acidobacteriota bacterium]